MGTKTRGKIHKDAFTELKVTSDDPSRRKLYFEKNISFRKRANWLAWQKQFLKISQPLALPHFSYYFLVRHNGNNAYRYKLFKLQRIAAHVNTGSNQNIRLVEILNNLQWDSIKTRIYEHENRIFQVMRVMPLPILSHIKWEPKLRLVQQNIKRLTKKVKRKRPSIWKVVLLEEEPSPEVTSRWV